MNIARHRPNPALNPAPFGRWTLRDKAAQRRLALRWAGDKMTRPEKVIQRAVELVDSTPQGKRYSDLIREISTTFPNIPVNTILGSIHKFRIRSRAAREEPDMFYVNKYLKLVEDELFT